ncbi:hypothetical protein V498_04661 [Pseudogymnoascus sp. VKM F-4517 (FW-2822)]|nr:hypothetical protein V498_04661 [Pseudogymnoascus sp. VKM F-4517 (FW-2822)]
MQDVKLRCNHFHKKRRDFSNAVSEVVPVAFNVLELKDRHSGVTNRPGRGEAKSQSSGVFCYNIDVMELAHPVSDVVAAQLIRGAEEIGSVLSKLAVSKGEKLKVAVTNPDTILEGPIYSSKELVIADFICAGIYASLKQLISKLNSEKSIAICGVLPNNTVRGFDGRATEVHRRWGDCDLPCVGTIGRDFGFG